MEKNALKRMATMHRMATTGLGIILTNDFLQNQSRWYFKSLDLKSKGVLFINILN